MKAVFIKFATLTILIYCKSSDKPEQFDYRDYVDQKILLKGYDEKSDFTDSLASISLKLPLRLDTFSFRLFDDGFDDHIAQTIMKIIGETKIVLGFFFCISGHLTFFY